MAKELIKEDIVGRYVFPEMVSRELCKRFPERKKSNYRLVQVRNNRVMVRTALSLAKSYYIPLGLNRGVNILLTDKENSACKKSGVMRLSLEVFKHAPYSPDRKIDVFMGEFIHEAAHFLYTDFKAMWNAGMNELQHNIWNYIEDDMIERRIANKFPGYIKYINAVREYVFEDKFNLMLARCKWHIAVSRTENEALIHRVMEGETEFSEEETAMIEEKLETVKLVDIFADGNAKRLSLMCMMIRWPDTIDEDLINDQEKFAVDLKAVLTPYPKSTKECIVASKVLYDKHFDKPDVRPEEDGEETAGKKMRKSKRLTLDQLMKWIKKHLESGDKKSLKDNEELMDISIEDIRKMVGEVFKDVEKELPKEEQSECGEHRRTKFYKITASDSDAVEESVAARRDIAKRATVIRHMLNKESRDRKLTISGTRSGVLDMNKIVEGSIGVPTVYQQFGTYKSKRLAVVALFDQSASIGGLYTDMVRIAALFDEMFGSNKDVDLFMYGFTGDIQGSGSTEIFIYREPGISGMHTIGHIKPMAQNRDGVAIREVGLRVRKFTKDPALFIMISDGSPCAYNYYGIDAEKHVREQVQEVERKRNFEFVHIGIPGNSIAASKRMYPTVIDYTSVGDLPNRISSLVKQFVTRKVKAEIKL